MRSLNVAGSTACCWIAAAHSLILLCVPASSGAQGGGNSFAATISANAVRLTAGDKTGFGFIVALGNRTVIIATARHTFDESGDGKAEVCFQHAPDNCAAGSVIYVADAIGSSTQLDLAFVSAPYPSGLTWRPDVDASKTLNATSVRTIGRAGDWYVPDTPGRIVSTDAENELVTYQGLSVAEGVSGAPVVSEDGIVAMHVRSLGDAEGAQGIALSSVRDRLEKYTQLRWLLVPRAACSTDQVHQPVLTSRRITIKFLQAVPAVAMQAAAKLHCLGAEVVLHPVWDVSEFGNVGVTYGSGGLRLARSLQSILAAYGRFDTSLGTPTGDAEIRIR